jgi:hypothetical protein
MRLVTFLALLTVGSLGFAFDKSFITIRREALLAKGLGGAREHIIATPDGVFVIVGGYLGGES